MATTKTPKRTTRTKGKPAARKRAPRKAYSGGDAALDSSWLIAAMSGSKTASGETVSPESAMGLAAFYACQRNISEDLAKLPMPIAKRLERGREPLPKHRVGRLFNDSPNPEMSAVAFRETMNGWAMGWGNGWAEIEWTGRGDVLYLWPRHPAYCELKRDDATKRLVLKISEPDKQTRHVAYENIFHLHGFGGDGLQGYSVARVGAESIGRAMATQSFSAAFYGNGAHLGTVLEHPAKLKDQARDNLRKSIAQSHSGAPNAFKTFVLEEGMKLSAGKFGIPPEEAQMLETMQFTVEDVARWFRCPLSKIQYFLRAQGWSTLELLNTDYVVDTLMPWDVRWSQEIQRKILLDPELYARHNFMGLLRGDAKARSEFYSAMFRMGVVSRNEIREREDENPVPGGDTYYIEGSNLVPLDAKGLPVQPEAPTPEPTPESREDRSEDPPDAAVATAEDDSRDQSATVTHALDVASVVVDKPGWGIAALTDALEVVRARIERKESKAIAASSKKRTGEEFTEWAREFYARLSKEAEEAAGPIMRAMAALNVEPQWSPSWYCESRLNEVTHESQA